MSLADYIEPRISVRDLLTVMDLIEAEMVRTTNPRKHKQLLQLTISLRSQNADHFVKTRFKNEKDSKQ